MLSRRHVNCGGESMWVNIRAKIKIKHSGLATTSARPIYQYAENVYLSVEKCVQIKKKDIL